MAINLKTRYGSRANDASVSYPTGSFKDKSAPTSTDGTPLQQDWANEFLGARDAILAAASISANGDIETASSSQVLDALKVLFSTPQNVADALSTKNLHFSKLTAGGNFSTPANITTSTVFKLTLIGGGGGGGGTSTTSRMGRGGGAGGAISFYISGLSPSTSYPVLIGAAGSGGSVTPTAGTNGGTTQITINSTIYSASGGVGGDADSVSLTAINMDQGAVSASASALPNQRHFQINSTAGFFIGGTYVGSNGASLFTGSGGVGGFSGSGTGSPATGNGAGGGGSSGGATGGNGSPGLFMAEWV